MEMNMPVAPMAYGNGAFCRGNDWDMFLIFAVLFGWGGVGTGFGRGGYASAFNSGELLADQFALQDLKNGQRAIDGGIRGLEQGVCSLGYETANQSALTREVVNTSAFGLERAIAGIGTQLSDCCCSNLRASDSIKYEMSRGFADVITANNLNTRDILENQNANTQRIVDMITQNEIQALRDKNNELTMSALLQQQTANITNITNPRSIPAYITCSPYEESDLAYGRFGACGTGCC